MNIVGYYRNLWPIFDAIPDGWVVDKNAGSPLHKHVFVNNGKSVLSGEQQKGLAPIEGHSAACSLTLGGSCEEKTQAQA